MPDAGPGGYPSPQDAADGASDAVSDDQLPKMAAAWLADGWESEELRQLATLSQSYGRAEGRRLLPEVLDSLGIESRDRKLARYTALVAWAVRQMDGPFTPYSAAEKVLELINDDPVLYDAPGVERLRRAMGVFRDDWRPGRQAEQSRLRAALLDLAASLGVEG